MGNSGANSKHQRHFPWAMVADAPVWLFIGGIAVYCLLVFFGAHNGVRGADQYWYLADVASLIEGRGAHSNLIFPYTVLTDGYNGPRPFVHNILYPYLSALPGHIFGPFAGGIITNAASQIFASLFICLLIIRLRGTRLLAVFVAVVYLLFPLNYWLSINLLAESSLVSLIMVLAAVLLCTNWRGWQWLVAAIVIGIMTFARGSFLLFAVMLPIAFLIANRPIEIVRILGSLGLLATILTFSWFWGYFYEHNVPCSLVERFNIMVPGQTSNMYCLFRLPDQPLMFFGWIDKVVHNLYRQFGFSDIYSFLFYWPINLFIVLVGFVLIKAQDREVKILGWLSLGLAIVQLGTLVITQNQFRYLVLLVPVSFVILAVFLNDYMQQIVYRHRYILCIVLVLALILVDYRFALQARHDALESAAEMEQLTTYIEENIRPDEIALLGSSEDTYGISVAIKIGFGLNPRSTLMLPATYETEIYDVLIRRFEPDLLILRRDSILKDELANIVKHKVSDFPGMFSYYSLYKVN